MFQIAVVWNLLVCNENMKGDIAYDIVKTIFDHKPELVTFHSEAKNITLEPRRLGVLRFHFTRGPFDISPRKGLRLNS